MNKGLKVNKRIKMEYDELKNQTDTGIYILSKSIQDYPWICAIDGPINSPYEGGFFKFKVEFSDDHPFKPPTIKSLDFIYHVNFYESKGICFTTTESTKWNPSQRIRTILLSLQSLLSVPNFGSPANPKCVTDYNAKDGTYEEKIKEMIQKHHRKP